MTFSITIRTFYRPENYLKQLVSRLVETETLTHRDVVGFHIAHGEHCTPNVNGVNALLKAVRDLSDWVIFLEDDIDIIDDFIPSVQRWLTDFQQDDILFYPLGSFYPFISKEHHERGCWDMGLDLYYGSQAVVFRREQALDYTRYLLSDQPASQWSYDAHFDMHLKEWQRHRRGAEITRTPAPGFVDHLGEHSLMGTWTRTGRMLDFAGRQGGYRGRQSQSSGERSAVQGISV